MMCIEGWFLKLDDVASLGQVMDIKLWTGFRECAKAFFCVLYTADGIITVHHTFSETGQGRR